MFSVLLRGLSASEIRAVIVLCNKYCSSLDYDSNGRLDGEIAGVTGDATPSLVESIGEFSFISRLIAPYEGY